MFLERAYFLPDYIRHSSLPKLFIRIRSVAIKFKGANALLYLTPDESKSADVRSLVRMGSTIGCDVSLPTGDAMLAWYISAGWQYGKFQLWVHGIAGGHIPQPDDPNLQLESWQIYEYSLYAEPSDGRRYPSLYDRPVDNYVSYDKLVINQNKYGMEIMERLKLQGDTKNKSASDLATLSADEVVTIVILRGGSDKTLGYLVFKDDVSIGDMTAELRKLVPAEHWHDCEHEMRYLAETIDRRREWTLSIPSHFETKRFSTESSHCQIGKSVFTIEDGVPKFNLFKENPADDIV